ncbi:hypothetical protein WJX82_006482 [Trebouxia sp. C0006]
MCFLGQLCGLRTRAPSEVQQVNATVRQRQASLHSPSEAARQASVKAFQLQAEIKEEVCRKAYAKVTETEATLAEKNDTIARLQRELQQACEQHQDDADRQQAHTQELQQGMASLVAASVHSEHLIQLFKHTLRAARADRSSMAGRLRSQMSHVASQHHCLKQDHLMLSAEGGGRWSQLDLASMQAARDLATNDMQKQVGMKDAALLQASMLAAASHDNLTRLESQQRELREMLTAHQALIAEREAARQTLDRAIQDVQGETAAYEATHTLAADRQVQLDKLVQQVADLRKTAQETQVQIQGMTVQGHEMVQERLVLEGKLVQLQHQLKATAAPSFPQHKVLGNTYHHAQEPAVDEVDERIPAHDPTCGWDYPEAGHTPNAEDRATPVNANRHNSVPRYWGHSSPNSSTWRHSADGSDSYSPTASPQAGGMSQMAGEQVWRHHEDVQWDNQPGSAVKATPQAPPHVPLLDDLKEQPRGQSEDGRPSRQTERSTGQKKAQVKNKKAPSWQHEGAFGGGQVLGGVSRRLGKTECERVAIWGHDKYLAMVSQDADTSANAVQMAAGNHQWT